MTRPPARTARSARPPQRRQPSVANGALVIQREFFALMGGPQRFQELFEHLPHTGLTPLRFRQRYRPAAIDKSPPRGHR